MFLAFFGKKKLYFEEKVFLFLLFSQIRLKLFVIIGNSEARCCYRILLINKTECKNDDSLSILRFKFGFSFFDPDMRTRKVCFFF